MGGGTKEARREKTSSKRWGRLRALNYFTKALQKEEPGGRTAARVHKKAKAKEERTQQNRSVEKRGKKGGGKEGRKKKIISPGRENPKKSTQQERTKSS